MTRSGANALFCVLSVACSSSTSSGGNNVGPDGGTTAKSLVGTWDLTTTPMGESTLTTVTIGQDSLTVTSPSFTLTATRNGSALTFTDEQTPGHPSADGVLTATQTVATFDAGILPFDLGGSWTMQAGPTGQSPVMSCTLDVGAAHIDGACQALTSDGFAFSFTTAKTASAASSFGDFGGTWNSTWTWPGTSGGSYPCKLDFADNGITTCAAPSGGTTAGSPLAGITFMYDGANTVSGAAQGWAEFSAMRR